MSAASGTRANTSRHDCRNPQFQEPMQSAVPGTSSLPHVYTQETKRKEASASRTMVVLADKLHSMQLIINPKRFSKRSSSGWE
jgi:hypothetical protein